MTTRRIAFVTGGTSGIGRAVVETLASRGVAVAFAGRSAERAAVVKEAAEKHGVPILFTRADVSSGRDVEDAMTATLERFGRIDCAVNAASSLDAGSFRKTAEVTETEYDTAMATNLKSVWLCMKAELAAMRRNDDGGAIVNVSSVNGLGGVPENALYATAKAGMLALTKSAALEYAAQRIRVNAVALGSFRTPMLEGVMRHYSGSDDVSEVEPQVARMNALGRLGHPSEAAAAIVWLCSDEASYVTGHTMIVDGGMTAGFR